MKIAIAEAEKKAADKIAEAEKIEADEIARTRFETKEKNRKIDYALTKYKEKLLKKQ